MPGAPPNLAVPKGWKPPPGVQKATPVPKTPAPRPNIGPWKSGYGPAPRPQAPAPRAPAFSPKLQETFRPLGHGVGAPSKLGNKATQERGAKTGRSFLGTIEDLFHGAYPQGTSRPGPGVEPASRSGASAAIAPTNPIANLKGFGETIEHVPGSAQRFALGIPTMVKGSAEALWGLAHFKPQLAEHMAGELVKPLKNPVKFIKEEPVTAAAMLLGPKAAIGKAGAAIAKTGAAGEALQSLADYTRPGIKLHNGVEVPAQASNDLLTKGTWKAKDAFSEKVLKHDPLSTVPSKVQRYIYGGGIVGHAVTKFTGKKVAGWVKPGLVDILRGQGETMARSYSHLFKRVIHQGERVYKPHELEAIVPIMEHTIHSPETAAVDIQHRLAELREEGKGLAAGGKEATENAAQIAQYEKLASNKKFLADPSREFAHAEHLTNLQDQIVPELTHAGVLEPNQVHAADVPYARNTLNAVYNTDPGKHPVTRDVERAETGLRRAKANVQKAIGERKATAEATKSNGGEHQPKTPRQGAQNTSTLGAHTNPVIESVHGNPHAPVTIYRVTTSNGRIDPNNWVTLEKPTQALAPGMRVVSKEVPAGAVFADMNKGPFGGLNPNELGTHQFSYQPHEHHLQTARDNVVNSENFLHRVKVEKRRLIETGGMKAGGDAWPRLEDQHGNPISHETILRHMQERYGDRTPGFITHKNVEPVETATRVTNAGRPGVGIKPRTGVSYGNGTYGAKYSDLIKQFELHARLLAEHQTENQMHNTFTFGYFPDAQTAKEWIAAHPELEKHLGPLVAVSRGPEKLLAKHNIFGDSGQKVLEQFGVHEAKTVREAGPGAKFGIQPKAAADRITEHGFVGSRHGGADVARTMTSLWRKAALYTSTHWPIGVGQENIIRTAMYGMSPLAMVPKLRELSPAYRAGTALHQASVDLSGWPQRATMADPTMPLHVKIAARQHAAGIDAGNFFGSIAQQMEPDLKHLLPHERSGFEAFSEAKGPAQAFHAWHAWEKGVGRLVTHFEVSARKAVEGKMALNEVTKFGSEWRALVKGEKDIVRKWVENKLPPHEAAAHAQKMMDIMGNWSNLTPALRSMRAVWSPFGLWYINSMKFLFKTMPHDHPMKTAALAALVQATGANKQTGTELEANKGENEFSVGNQPLTLPIAGEVGLNMLHYTPLDVAREPGKKAGEMFLPQLVQPLEEAGGIGALKKTKTGAPWPVALGRAGENAAIGMVPFARPLAEILKQGGKADETSLNPLAIKPGSARGYGAAAMKYGFPLPFTFGPKKTKGLGGGEKLGQKEAIGGLERLGKAEKLGR